MLPSNPTRIDTIGAAILVQLLTDYPADGIVLRPVDWMIIRQTNNATGEHPFGDPGANVEPVCSDYLLPLRRLRRSGTI